MSKRWGPQKKPLLDWVGPVPAENVYSDFDLRQSAISGPDG